MWARPPPPIKRPVVVRNTKILSIGEGYITSAQQVRETEKLDSTVMSEQHRIYAGRRAHVKNPVHPQGGRNIVIQE